VSSDRLKMLTSLNQNGKRPGSGADVSPDANVESPVYRWNLSHPKGTYAERGKPDCLHESGNRTARGGHSQAGMGFRRKRKPCCNRADRGSRFALALKGADFRKVFHHEII
jgi:hypothetical protein